MEVDEEFNESFDSFASLAERTSSLRLRERKALADSLEAQFQPVDEPSDLTVIETFGDVVGAYECAPARQNTERKTIEK
jgi:hypothetical protein